MKYSILVQLDFSNHFVKLLKTFDSIDECIEEVKLFDDHFYRMMERDKSFDYHIQKDQERIKSIIDCNYDQYVEQYHFDYLKSKHVVCYIENEENVELNTFFIIQED